MVRNTVDPPLPPKRPDNRLGYAVVGARAELARNRAKRRKIEAILLDKSIGPLLTDTTLGDLMKAGRAFQKAETIAEKYLKAHFGS